VAVIYALLPLSQIPTDTLRILVTRYFVTLSLTLQTFIIPEI